MGPHPLLLLVCDHRGEGLADRLKPLASVGFRLDETESVAATRERLSRGLPGLVVLDPLARGGVVELEDLSQVLSNRGVPVLLVADPAEPVLAVLAARSLGDGPWDLIYRNAPLEEYLLRIERLRRQAEGLSELDEMRFQAVHDDRTELLRPVPFLKRLREHFSASQRHRLDLALVLLDLDRFGRVNKEFDHTIGDCVIDRVGTCIRETLREEDVGGRLGGDEFAIVLPYTRRVDAARVVHRLRDQIRAITGPMDGSGRIVSVSASIGFETADGTDLESVEALRRHAELALKGAKEMGGNRAVYYRSLPGATNARPAGEDAEEGESAAPPAEREVTIQPTTLRWTGADPA